MSEMTRPGSGSSIDERTELRDRCRRAAELYRHAGFRGLEDARRLLESVTEAAAQQGYDDVLVDALVDLAANRRRAGSLHEAQRFAVRALALSTTTSDRLGQSRAHLETARVFLARGRYHDAAEQLDRADDLCGPGEPSLAARIQYARAKLARRHGDLPGAVEAAGRAVQLSHEAGNAYSEARSLALLGYIERLTGSLEKAVGHLRASREMAERHDFPLVLAHTQLDLGQIARVRHNFEEALRRIHNSFDAFWQMGDRMGVAHTYGAFAVLYRTAGSMGLLHAATNYARAAVTIYESAAHPTAEAVSRRRLGECLRDTGRYDEARVELHRALAIYRAMGRIHDEALVLAAMAKLERRCQGPAVALGLAREARRKLDLVRRQFGDGRESELFGRRYAWVYAVSLVCALESGSTEADSQIAVLLEEGSLRSAARAQLSRLSGRTGSLIGQITECQAELGSPRLTRADEKRLRTSMARLCAELKRDAPDIARVLGSQVPLETDSGVHVLSIDLQGDDAAWVAWEPPAGGPVVGNHPLSRQDRRSLVGLVEGRRDALWDARPQPLERLAASLLPEGLRAALLARDVKLLRLVPSLALRRVPFGSLRIGARSLDELTCVVWMALPPPDESPRLDDAAPGSPPGYGAASHLGEGPLLSVARRSGLTAGTGVSSPGASAPLDKVRVEALFEADPELSARLREDVEARRAEGSGLGEALRIVRARHRRLCGQTCPPAHLGGIVMTADPDADFRGPALLESSERPLPRELREVGEAVRSRAAGRSHGS